MTIEEVVALNLVQRPIYKYTTSTASYDTTYSLSPLEWQLVFTQDTTLASDMVFLQKETEPKNQRQSKLKPL